MNSARVPYLFYDENSGRVCGFSIVRGEHWDIQQAHLLGSRPDNKLRMVPIWDAKQLEELRANGPHNFTVSENGSLVLLPPHQRNLTPQIVVAGDDQLLALNQKMDTMIQLLTDLPERMGAATEAAMRRAIH